VLATFVIGLREGLEAALIVGIIAAFLRKNGRSLRPMALGVVAAVLLSLGVGVTLHLVEQELPQAAQEGMETIIGIVAIVFVTGMVLWMNTHARGLKKELEAEAGQALGSGSSRALVVMAFLAVLKEGFETAVFLLATFSASTNAGLAALGAGLGLLAAVVIGYGLYRGSVRLNLGRFFSITGVFLLLVAAGLVVSTLGTAHEAGWLNAGQQRTVDLSWLAPKGSIRGALFTGVLGIPQDPRLIQVIGWFAYLVPMALVMYWPRAHRPGVTAAQRLRLGIAAGLAAIAAALALAVGPASMPSLGAATLLGDSGAAAGSVLVQGTAATIAAGSTTDAMPLTGGQATAHASVPNAVLYTQSLDASAAGLPASLSLDELVALNGGRLPVGVNPQLASGPFTAAWTRTGERQLWLVEGQVLDFTQSDVTSLTLSGGGLASTRTITVSGTLPDGTAVSGGTLSADPARVTATAQAAADLRADAVERQFWGRTLPALLAVAALLVLLAAWRARRRLLPTTQAQPVEAPVNERKLNVA
jgi:high-affinity iron transporter